MFYNDNFLDDVTFEKLFGHSFFVKTMACLVSNCGAASCKFSTRRSGLADHSGVFSWHDLLIHFPVLLLAAGTARVLTAPGFNRHRDDHIDTSSSS